MPIGIFSRLKKNSQYSRNSAARQPRYSGSFYTATMSRPKQPITVPPAAELLARIRALQTEVAALKKLHRLAQAAEAAAAAKTKGGAK